MSFEHYSNDIFRFFTRSAHLVYQLSGSLREFRQATAFNNRCTRLDKL